MNRNTQFDPSSEWHTPARRRITLLALVAVGAAIMVLARAAVPATISSIILLVGADESQRVVNWYASADTSQMVQVAPTSELLNGEFPSSAKTYPAVVAANTVNGGFNGHAILDHLKENTVYSYRVGDDWRLVRDVRSSRPASSTATSTSCSSATRRSARRATSPKTRRAGRTP